MKGFIMLLFIDTETTGKYDFKADFKASHQPHLVQLACILDDLDGNTVEEYETIIRVSEVNIPASAAAIHGITTAIANASGIDLKEALREYYRLCKKTNRIVAHNINFDMRIMASAIHRAKVDDFFKMIPTYCTMEKATNLLKLPGRYGNYKWPTLDEAYRTLIDPEGFEGAHNALNDVRACRSVYYALRKLGR